MGSSARILQHVRRRMVIVVLGCLTFAGGARAEVTRVDVTRRHRRYGKILRTSTKLHVHDERNDAGAGDTVRVVECRPMSRTKRWRLVDVLERAK